ncbi:hypothetical protein T492DRAFT_865750, partial [Pavlovales sp. CCMP2436]
MDSCTPRSVSGIFQSGMRVYRLLAPRAAAVTAALLIDGSDSRAWVKHVSTGIGDRRGSAMGRLTLNQSLAAYAVLAVCIAIGATAFARSAPPLPATQCANIVTPLDVVRGRLVREPRESILGLWSCLKEYKRDNWWYTTLGLWGTYALFKVFGPLGAGTSMVLSILIGALYDEWSVDIGGLRYSLLAHMLGVSGEVCGGVGGYFMSYLVGREILFAFAAEKMATLHAKMGEYEGSLFR